MILLRCKFCRGLPKIVKNFYEYAPRYLAVCDRCHVVRCAGDTTGEVSRRWNNWCRGRI